MKHLISIFFLSLTTFSFSQVSKWHIGTKWVYDFSDISDGYDQLIVVGDTVIQTYNCLEVEKTSFRKNQYFDSQLQKVIEKWEKETVFEYVAWYPDSILWFNKKQNNFAKLYDFTLKAGDSLRVNKETYYKVESVKDSIIGGVNRKIQVVDGLIASVIIQGIGSTRDFFSPSDIYFVIPEMRRNLTCFIEGEFKFADFMCHPESLIKEETSDVYLPFSKWIYSNTNNRNFGDPFYSIDSIIVENDTIVTGFFGKIFRSSSNEKYVLRHTQNGISFLFDNNWRKIASYNLKIGDFTQFELLAQNPKTFEKDTLIKILCQLETVDTLFTEKGEKLRRFNFKIQNPSLLEENWVNVHGYSYIEHIGSEYSFLPCLELPSIANAKPLRCANGQEDYFVSDYWKGQSYDCDYITSIYSEKESNAVLIVGSQVHFLEKGNFILISANGYILQDQEVESNDMIDFSSLVSGVYIMKFQNSENEALLSKLFVK